MKKKKLPRGRPPLPPMTEKACKKCGEVKKLSEYAKRKDKPHGHVSRCKECCAAASRDYYLIHREKVTARALRWRDKNKERYTELVKRGMDRIESQFPERRRAKNFLNLAVKYGVVTPQPCEVCGDVKAEGHHTSYAPPMWLTVKWLCRKHHAQEHMGPRKTKGRS